MSQLSVEHIAKSYPTRAEPLAVLADVSFELASGQSLAVLGPSGSGKSTLLSILGTLEPPTSGRVLLDGQNPQTLSEPELARFRARQIGFVFQDHHLLPQCSVLENVLVSALAEGTVQKAQVDRARTLIDQVGLSARIEHRPAELSGGERQRAALARALVNSPRLVLADEPTGNLDRKTAAAIGELLVDLVSREQTMLVVVTHSTELAARLARRCELEDGRLVSV